MAPAGQSLLFQTESHDLATFATVPLVLATVALIACALPAYRASRDVDIGASTWYLCWRSKEVNLSDGSA